MVLRHLYHLKSGLDVGNIKTFEIESLRKKVVGNRNLPVNLNLNLKYKYRAKMPYAEE